MADPKPGQRPRGFYRYGHQEFWPERGLVHIEDQRDGSYVSLSAAEAFARAISFNQEVKAAAADTSLTDRVMYPDERAEILKMVVDLMACVKEARRQGDPTDPEVSRSVARANRPCQVLLGPDAKPLNRPSSPPPAPLGGKFAGATLLPSHRERKIAPPVRVNRDAN